MHPFIPLTEFQHNALTGNMLGDGSLHMGRKNANFIIHRALKDKNYLQYEANIFDQWIAPRYRQDGTNIATYSFFKESRGVIETGCKFGTVASPSFTPYYDLWYPNNEKHVPFDLKLNGQIIAHWLADDGCLQMPKLPYRFVLELSTHGFLKEEVEFLAKSLSDRYNEEFMVKVKTRKKTNKTWYIIKAYDSACRAMFADIDPYMKMTRKRVWDATDARFWNDPPERQRSMLKDFAAKKELVKQTIEDGKDFLLFDLAEKVDYASGNDISYTAINKLLQPYLDSGKISKFYDKQDNNTCHIIINKDIKT